MVTITPEDRAAIAAAVTATEAGTDAEIVPIVAAQSDAYHDVALHWMILGALLLIAVMAAVPGHFVSILDRVYGGWGREWSMGELLAALLVLLAFVLLLLRVATAPLVVRMALTPPATKARRVRRRAVLLFRTAIEARTASRTGVLLYLSLAERRAEIVSDAAVLERIDPADWGGAMAALLDHLRDERLGVGMSAAIGRIGTVLAGHFPHTGTDPNELPDRLIEL